MEFRFFYVFFFLKYVEIFWKIPNFYAEINYFFHSNLALILCCIFIPCCFGMHYNMKGQVLSLKWSTINAPNNHTLHKGGSLLKYIQVKLKACQLGWHLCVSFEPLELFKGELPSNTLIFPVQTHFQRCWKKKSLFEHVEAETAGRA